MICLYRAAWLMSEVDRLGYYTVLDTVRDMYRFGHVQYAYQYY